MLQGKEDRKLPSFFVALLLLLLYECLESKSRMSDCDYLSTGCNDILTPSIIPIIDKYSSRMDTFEYIS